MTFRQRFSINGIELEESDPTLQAVLAKVYNTQDRPKCLCVPQGVEMYVAKYAEYVIKRLPDTGCKHHPTCVAFEMDVADSGRGELLGKAITEHAPSEWEIRTKFALTRTPGRSIQRGAAGTPTEVKTRAKAASMLALLHELWERTGYNKWYPGMDGKRWWGTLRTHVMAEAARARTKNTVLSEVLLMPEPLAKDPAKAKLQEEARRRAMLPLTSPKGDVQHRFMIIVAEILSAEKSALGYKLKFVHMPELTVLVETDTWTRIIKTFELLFRVRDTDEKSHLLVAGLIYSPADQIYAADELTLMLTTEQWIPIEDGNDNALLKRLVEEKRSFIRPLRYDSKEWGGFANARLLDAGDATVALHILSDRLAPNVKMDKEAAVKDKDGLWVWNVNDGDIPSLPPLMQRRRVVQQAADNVPSDAARRNPTSAVAT